ncbi:MAG: alanine racemase [Chitinispirillaceae bacterium]|nr:alanine racemase [Chitinispirillaceae bacterium]
MNRLCVNLEALQHNLLQIEELISGRGASWTLVTKVLCGNREMLEAIVEMGIKSIGDTRLANFRQVESIQPALERWYLRVPNHSIADDVVHLTTVSLNSEISTIERLNKAAAEQNKKHNVIIMIELGDLREGILPGSLISFYTHVFAFENIEVLGIGANLGCLAGGVPSVDQLMQLVLYRELLELKFKHELPFISAGTSAILPLLGVQGVPRAINHFRIGEAAFLGTDLINGKTLEGFRNDVFILETEIAELKHKSMTPLCGTGDVAPFDTSDMSSDYSPGERGHRALITVGQLDTDVRGLTPIDESCRLVGASSDLSVVHIDRNKSAYRVGDTLSFRMNYPALLRLMIDPYVPKVLTAEPAKAIERKSSGDLHKAVPRVNRIKSRKKQ